MKICRLALVSLALFAAGCGGGLQQAIDEHLPRADTQYQSSRSLPPLEIPPDLSSATIKDGAVVPQVDSSGSMSYSDYAGTGEKKKAGEQRSVVLPSLEKVRVERNGDKRWLVIKASADAVWPRAHDFWLENGFLIKSAEPAVGILETDWAEKRESHPTGLVQGLLSKISKQIYSFAVRDKFRVRLERGSLEGTTELFISHQRVEEVAVKDDIMWQTSPADPELEAEMLNRMLLYFGVTEEKVVEIMAATASRAPRAHLVKDKQGSTVLSLREGFSRAWRRTGLALDRVGFTVQDRDRSRGLYFVRYVDPLVAEKKKKGFFGKLKFWGKDKKPKNIEYFISLVGEQAATQVVVLDKAGERDTGSTADRILALLHKQLK